MIYRFSEDEEKHLMTLYREILERITHEKMSGDNLYNNEFIDSFFNEIDRIKGARFKKLKTNEEIIKNAIELVKDTLVYEYISQEMKKESDNQSKVINANNYNGVAKFIRFYSWPSLQVKFYEQLESKEKPVFTFTKDSFLRYIEENIINLHIEALERSPEKKILKSKISNVLDKSIYIDHTPHNKDVKRTKRTKAKAKELGAIVEAPENLIIPTINNYQYSMSLYQGGNSYLQLIRSADKLRFENGKLYFADERAREISEAELRDLRTKEGIESLDTVSLRYYYGFLLKCFQENNYQSLQDTISISVSELVGRADPNEHDIKAVLSKLQSYHNVMGVIKSSFNGRIIESYYQVLNFEYYDRVNNIIAFSSPYMNYVIKKIYDIASRNESGQPQITRKSQKLSIPTHSYLIKSSIVKERNKAAVENVVLIVALIEQAGNSEPHIKAKTLIERNVQLSERLAASKNPRALLKRVFEKTWELLSEQTHLKESYKDIQLPDPKDPAFLPTMSNLDGLVFKFPHKGKKK